MALARVMIQLRRRLGLEIEVFTVHHGQQGYSGGSPQLSERLREQMLEQLKYRDDAVQLVKREIANLDPSIPVYSVKVSDVEDRRTKPSEAQMRRHRWDLLKEHIRMHGSYDWVLLAHHADDLLETRLIRLLRGTGPQGLLAMKTLSVREGVPVWRPFLPISGSLVKRYLVEQGCREGENWLDDPSNCDPSILRNRVRHELLPLVENLRSGGVGSLMRSLELLAASEAIEQAPDADGSRSKNHGLERATLMNLSPLARRQVMSRWLKEQNVSDYSAAHIEEVLKRLDTRQKRLKFELCGRVWLVDTHIQLVAPSQLFSNSTSS